MVIKERWAPGLLAAAAATGIGGTFLPKLALGQTLPNDQSWSVEWSSWEVLASSDDMGLWAQMGLAAVDPSARAKGTLVVLALLAVAVSGGMLVVARRKPGWVGRARAAVTTSVAVLVGVLAMAVVETLAETKPQEAADTLNFAEVTAGPASAVLVVAGLLAVAGALAVRKPPAEPEVDAELDTPPMGIRRID